jgi:hypothetical protein
MKLERACLLLAMLMPVVTSAATISENGFPVGLWNTVHYKSNNPDRTPLNVKICVKANGTWESVGVASGGMRGAWKRNADAVHVSGNGVDFDGVGLAGTGDLTMITPYSMMTGKWQSWPLDKPTEQHTAYNSKWTLAGKNCPSKSK